TVVLRGPFHLGRKVVPGFRQPSPQGETLELEFENDPEATATALSVWVRGMEPQTRLAPFEHALEKGALRTEVWLNGKNLAYRYPNIDSAADAPTRVRLPIFAEFLQEGANRWELRLPPDTTSGTVDESEASDLAIEHVIDEGE